MLVEPSQNYLKNFLQTYRKEDNLFVIPQKQLKTIEQLVDQILYATFNKTESFLIILLRKFVLQLVNRKLSLPLLEEIFLILKQYENQIASYKQHFFQLEELMFQQENKCQQPIILEQEIQEKTDDQKNWSFFLNHPHQSSPELESMLGFTPTNSKLAKSLTMDIECYSQDSKYNFMSSSQDKYLCSEYLTTSQDEKQGTSLATFQQLKQKMKHKLKIQQLVSVFNYGLKPRFPLIEFEEELKQWKCLKKSILRQPCFDRALASQQYDQSMMVNKAKQNHYRQKIKSVIMRKRLSTKNDAT